jgi:ribose transport system ATP-binding protein
MNPAVVENTTPVLEMRGITKRFPGLTALDQVDFSVRRNEIHALIGQNGAGKSTLMKVLAGVYQPDLGEIIVEGQPVRFHHPRDALQRGIGTVYQDLSLVPKLTVAGNIFLGREIGGFVINDRQNIHEAQKILDDLGVREIDARARLEDLPLAQKQLVEIARVLSYNPHILVLDEPTAALADEETALLFRILHRLKERGIAIIFISHRFKEILGHCDRATVLRNGQLVKTLDIHDTTEDELVELTIGERLESFYHYQRTGREVGPPVLQVEDLNVGRVAQGVSFTLHKGEIVGLTGLLGAGQNELARALFGLEVGVSGMVRRNGVPVLITSPRVAIQQGIGLLTENRKTEGLVLDMSVRSNITLAALNRFRSALLFIRKRQEHQEAQALINHLQVKAPAPTALVGMLSGGNQQKVVLAKWLLRDLDILIFIAPTQGIDVGARLEIYQHLSALAAEGKSLIVVSEDLVEILGISDRIFIMYSGKLTQIIDRAHASEDQLLAAVQGN